MTSRKFVAVSAAVRCDGTPLHVHLNVAYLRALEHAGLVPLVTAPLQDAASATDILSRVDGLLLTGGEDVNPAHYGARPHPKLGTVSDERDTWERTLIREAERLRLPTLGICRGIQILNVALGGTLIQDLPSERPSGVDHHPDAGRSTRSHVVELTAGSRLADAVGATHIKVNSIHHQAVGRVAESLRVNAVARDGVVEGVECRAADWWCVGVQWHPEELHASAEPWERGLFSAFASVMRSPSISPAAP